MRGQIQAFVRAGLRAGFAAGLALAFAGCGAQGKGEPDALVMEGGKADIYDRVSDHGSLGIDEFREGTFTEDLELHAFRLSVRGGASVTVENTQTGTDRDLDTVLYIFGPWNGTGFGNRSLAVDDDSGWGEHARIDAFTPAGGGEYLVVLGTFSGDGRGAYRVEARCESEACDFVSLPAVATECQADILAGVDACVDNVLADPDNNLPVGEAVYACADAEPLAPAHDAVCAKAPETDFCGLEYEAFVAYMAPICLGEVALLRRVNAIGLHEEPTPQPSLEALDCGDDCDVIYEPYTYSPVVVATIEGVVGATWDDVARLLGVEPDSLDVTFGVAQVEEGAHGAFHYAATEAGGEHIPQDIAKITSAENPSDTVYVVHFPRTQDVAILVVDRRPE